jgi:putative colanic acid biosysnthesis UDP-glucose lipid carrier transferase
MNSRFSNTISEPAIFRASSMMACVTALQMIAPAIVASLGLFVICVFYGVAFDQRMVILAGLSSALCVVLLRPGFDAGTDLVNPRVTLALNVLQRWLLLLGMLLLIGYAAKLSANFSRRVVLTWALLTPVLLVFVSLALQRFLNFVMADVANRRSVLFVGVNDASTSLAARLRKSDHLNLSVAGFFDDRSAERLGVEAALPLLGRLPDIVSYINTHGIDMIFIALPIRHMQRVLDLIDQLRDTTVSIYYVPDICVFDLIQARTRDILGIPVIAMCETPFSGYRGAAKRLTDITLSVLLLPLLLPAILVIAVMIKSTSPGPVFFRQRRYGLDGREILVYKFRTMNVIEDGTRVVQATAHDPRVTPVGRLLRRYSLDELPQLFNVLRGTMSLVGPRPHAVIHNEQYRKLIKGYMVRHKVPPGITGLAQVNGCRGETAQLEQMQARVDYDLEYLRRWSPLLDIKILMATAVQLTGRGKAY